MRHAIITGRCLLVCVLVLAWGGVGAAQTSNAGVMMPQCAVTVKPAAASLPAVAVRQRVHQDARSGATFFFSSTADGAARMTVIGGELQIEKIVYADGRFRVALQAGDDLVSIAGMPGIVKVQRGKERGRSLDVGRASEDEWLQTKVVLAGSRAVRLFRALADSLENGTLQTPAGTAVLMTDALLGLLDGDVGAVHRLGERLRAARQAKIRPAALGQAEFLMCYYKFAWAADEALDTYYDCAKNYYNWDPRQLGCSFQWVLMAESAWWQFIGCSTFPF